MLGGFSDFCDSLVWIPWRAHLKAVSFSQVLSKWNWHAYSEQS